MMFVESGEFDPDTMYNSYGIQFDTTAFLVGLIVSVLLMTALIIRPEWYIVNTVGVLVGAGVIVMLGVTFVPTLIVIFMVLAAIYDAWAVYRSKHMLDLADTMIGLNLPILLVAPQESGYSMLDEKDSIRPVEAQKTVMTETKSIDDKAKLVKRKKPKEAMFMGLGDVIFPGMLVISCVNYITDSGLAVGISALIGGLIGYFILMTYVASGRPQAGLPLLNGGAILGYIIGGLIFVGSSAFSFGISF
jgi:presenilin-like A22 family membrane protease